MRKRLARRLTALGLGDLNAYRERLETDATEWERLDALCRVTVSRFYRDRRVWDFVSHALLADLEALALRRGDGELRCWSAGCASGEEPYTLAMAWLGRPPSTRQLPLRILATDADANLLERARRGLYGRSSVGDLPDGLRRYLTPVGDRYRVDSVCREPITFECRDIRGEPPLGKFHLVLCRNLVFTYFDKTLQSRLSAFIAERLVPGGALIVGAHETPAAPPGLLSATPACRGVYVRLPVPPCPRRRSG